jgi:hypothetical protein
VTSWPYQVVGAGYGLLGVAFIAVGHLRLREVDAALERGAFVHPHTRLLGGLLTAGLVLGAATVVLVVFGSI